MPESSVIRLPSRFDYSLHRQFMDDCTKAIEDSEVPDITLDFSQVDYIDSSALGMMVLMQKKSQVKNKKIKVKGAKGATDEILKMANMQKIFEFI